MTNKLEDNLVWIDLEMTGLDPKVDTILEVAVLVTDANLNILGEDDTHYILHKASDFESMNDWCQEQHTKSGLWDKVLKAKTSIESVEEAVVKFLAQYTVDGKNVLCGNSIHQDRRFIRKYMKKLDEHLHYRMIDVSTIKELSKRWYPNHEEKYEKKGSHRAYDDIVESIEELQFYRKHFFK